MAAGQVTSEQLVSRYIARIKAYDQAGPRLNSVIAINPRAASDARELDRERRERGPRGPLHGVPVLLKDNFDTADMPTTGGSLALVGIVPSQDAYQVRMLRRAGAVLLGKVNLHELALGLTSVSSYGGQTLNPYDLTRAPGGSSGGSGVAACRVLRRVHDGYRHERIDPHPELSQLDRRPSSVAGSVEPRRHHSVRPHPGHRRPDGTNRRGHRASSSTQPSATTPRIPRPPRAADGYLEPMSRR